MHRLRPPRSQYNERCGVIYTDDALVILMSRPYSWVRSGREIIRRRLRAPRPAVVDGAHFVARGSIARNSTCHTVKLHNKSNGDRIDLAFVFVEKSSSVLRGSLDCRAVRSSLL